MPRPVNFKTYIDIFKSFNKNKKFSILHFNIVTLIAKIDELLEILNLRCFDIIMLNETKIDENTPLKFFMSMFYTCIRRDRTANGGGILVYIRKEYKIIKQEVSVDYEIIYFQLLVENNLCNFICAYNPNKKFAVEFNNHLETNFLLSLNLDQNLFIIGDLNQDLLSVCGSHLQKLLDNYEFKNYILEPTRVNTKYYKKTKSYKTSKTLLDVVIHNNNLIKRSMVVPCFFSDHKFVCCQIEFEKALKQDTEALLRQLNSANLDTIICMIEAIDFTSIEESFSVHEKWNSFKESILTVVNSVAPIKKVKLRPKGRSNPWFDSELREAMVQREIANNAYESSGSIDDLNSLSKAKKNFKSLKKEKLIEFFSDKTGKDFKNTKKYWYFYSSLINIKSNNNSNELPSIMSNGSEYADSPKTIACLFNKFFTSIQSNSLAEDDECRKYVIDRFKLIKENKLIGTPSNKFEFEDVTVETVIKAMSNLNPTSSPGINEIPTKILKMSINKLAPIQMDLFNSCFAQKEIPNDWKFAVVTPLHKGKKTNKQKCDNYRGINVLVPIAKVFESILTNQLERYFYLNNFISQNQHGFRRGFSCETALNELLNFLNLSRDQKRIIMLLFIDYRKAFDTVDSSILLLKLEFGYNFSKSAIDLIANYFKHRKQVVKFGFNLSETEDIDLGIPQGGKVGPFFSRL